MELSGERVIPASVTATWNALNDPAVLKTCIAGCESLDRSDPDAMAVVLALKIGPISARFKGNITLSNMRPPTGCTLNFEGQGGIAGFGKGAADIELSDQAPAQTLLRYTARATVGGKVAQIGSRLVDAAAGKIVADFFKAFEAHLNGEEQAPKA